jgi:hypothetical protein
MTNWTARLKSPYGSWRLEDGHGSILTIPNGIVGTKLADGTFSCFQGRVILDVPKHWLEAVVHGEQGDEK